MQDLSAPVRGFVNISYDIYDVLADGKCTGVVDRKREVSVLFTTETKEESERIWENIKRFLKSEEFNERIRRVE